jgi:iron complex transport system substrate-binding protein
MKRIISGFLVAFVLLLCPMVGAAEFVNMDMEVVEEVYYVKAQGLEVLGLTVNESPGEVILKDPYADLRFALNSNQVKVNGLPLTLAVKPYKKGHDIYLPLSFILETMNYRAEYGEGSIEVSREEEPISEEYRTIISLSPGVTEKLFALGVGHRIKGRTKYCNFPEGVQDIEVVGTLYEPDLELILSMEPDIVIAESFFKEEILKKFDEAGIATVARKTAVDIDDIYEYMLELGRLTGKNYEARALVASLRSKVARVEYVLRDVPDRPTAYYIVGTGQWGEYTAGRGTFTSQLITLAGAKNAASDVEGWSYSLERLIDNDPDFIFASDFNIKTMLNGEAYQMLSAVKNGKYLIVNPDIFERASPRALDEGLKILVGLFHPEALERLNF